MKDETVDVWAIDEVHFQQYGSRCRMWIPPEERTPVLTHFPGRKSIGFFGAVRIRDGKFVHQREDGVFDAQSYFSFLKMLHRKSRVAGRKVYVIVDNVKYHHALLHKEWRQIHDPEFHCEFLPPYSPDLNPIERVWKLTRRKGVHNRYFAKLLEIAESVEGVFSEWLRPNETLRRLCKF